ncbi:unnamed protein product [Peniophora sp. CBMAI 1063]|nr:unnamed protein product [Peniophora sp. CBMAI 1063]
MAGNCPEDAIELSSSDDFMTDGGEEDSDSEGADIPGDSNSDDDPLFPPVEPARGDEDDESSSDEDYATASPGVSFVAFCASRLDVIAPAAPTRRLTPPATSGPAPQMPAFPPRQPYVMNHSTASLPLRVNVAIPPAFSRAGLHNSQHFNQWLLHIRDSSVAAPPYSEYMEDLHAAVGIQLGVTLQQEAANLLTWRTLLEGTESEILELDRLQFILARMATNPLLRAAAAVQGADLTLPQTLLDRAAAPPPNITVGLDGDTDSGAETPSVDRSPGAKPHSKSKGSKRRRTLVADMIPVDFSGTTASLLEKPAMPLPGEADSAGGSSKSTNAVGTRSGSSGTVMPVAGPSRIQERAIAPPPALAERTPTPGPGISRPGHVRRRSDSASPTRPPAGDRRHKRRRKRRDEVDYSRD